MFTPVTFPTALIFWLTYKNNSELVSINNSLPFHNTDSFQRSRLLSDLQIYGLPKPFHIMVPERSLRNHGKDFTCHLMPRNLPRGSFMELTDFLQIISPELCFALAANYLSIPELAVLACDLCGIYAFDEYDEFGQINRKPITTVDKISKYVNKAKNLSGIKKARTAIAFALDRSNSPVESKLAVTAILRYLYGGYSYEHPILNYYVSLPEQIARTVKREQFCCDMVWPEKKVIVEYDSDLAHLSKDRFYKDKKRTMALSAAGYTILNITKDAFHNFYSIDDQFLMIGNTLGKKIKHQYFDASLEQRQELINKFFLTPNYMNWLTMFTANNECSK